MTRYDAPVRWRTDAAAVRATRVSEDGLMDAIRICALFSMIVRLADSSAGTSRRFESFLDRADAMLASGYALETG
jgi:hypothetical protein